MTSTVPKRRAVVVGAGVIGMSIAYELLQRKFSVTVVDAKPLPSGCSLANAGWVDPHTTQPLPSPAVLRYGLLKMISPSSPLYIKPRASLSLAKWLLGFVRASTARSFEAGRQAVISLGRDSYAEYGRLAKEIDFRINAHESLSVYSSEEAAHRAASDLSFLSELGITSDHEVLGSSEVQKREPVLSDVAQGGLVVRGDLQIEPDSFLSALSTAVEKMGGRIVRDSEVIAFETRNSTVHSAVTTQGKVDGDVFIIAAGSWSSAVLKMLGISIVMEPGKGYSFSLDLATPPTRMINLADAKVGIVPHRGGTRLVGTMELSGVNEKIDVRRIVGILEAARPYVRDWPVVPSDLNNLDDLMVGLRPMFSDGLPVIDVVPELGNAFVSTGHAMMGVSLALSTARNLSSFIESGVRPEILEPFSISRFH